MRNASYPMYVTEPGMDTDSRDEHPENALSPIAVAPSPMTADLREMQL